MNLKRIITILVLLTILIGLIVAYVIQNSNNEDTVANFNTTQKYNSSINADSSSSKGQKTEKKTIISSNAEIKSALVEKIEPHATYYLSELCVEECQFVSKDTNIIKYKNGTYFTAPYDCVITELNLPEVDGKLLNSHYVEVSSTNMLSVTLNVDESKIGNLTVGNEAKISVVTSENTYTGYVTAISSTASNGRFKVTIEFENDGNIKLGMTAQVEITL